jgi:hypothetical protein
MPLELVAVLGAVGAASAIWAHDFLEGETLLADLADEVFIARADIFRLDAFCRANPARSDTIISLTTIPSRIAAIGDTLKSLLRQSRAPAEIRLNLPAYCKRERAPYVVPAWLGGLRSVTIVACDDLGPATKLLPALGALPPNQKIVALDDDRIYPRSLLADLDAAAQSLPDAALGLSGWRVPPDLIDRPTTLLTNIRTTPPAPIRGRRVRVPTPVDILQGMSGYLVRPRYFDLAALGDYSCAPAAASFVDDVWISAQCRAPKYVIPVRRSNFQPYRRIRLYKKTGLGLVNRGGGDVNRRNNTVMLKYFASRWAADGAER